MRQAQNLQAANGSRALLTALKRLACCSEPLAYGSSQARLEGTADCPEATQLVAHCPNQSADHLVEQSQVGTMPML